MSKFSSNALFSKWNLTRSSECELIGPEILIVPTITVSNCSAGTGGGVIRISGLSLVMKYQEGS
jgi:hypothetical protein